MLVFDSVQFLTLWQKLFLNLCVHDLMELKHLPEGSRLKRWCPGWDGSFSMLAALLRQNRLNKSSNEVSDTVRQHTLDGAAVEGYQQSLLVCSNPQEAESLLCLLDQTFTVMVLVDQERFYQCAKQRT